MIKSDTNRNSKCAALVSPWKVTELIGIRRVITDEINLIQALRWNHTYIDSPRMAENRRIPNMHNILGHCRINWRVIAKTDFHIRYSPIFVFSKNLELLKMYSAHNDEYGECTNILIHTSLVRLFSPNVLGYSPRINVCAVPPLHSFSIHWKDIPLFIQLALSRTQRL